MEMFSSFVSENCYCFRNNAGCPQATPGVCFTLNVKHPTVPEVSLSSSPDEGTQAEMSTVHFPSQMLSNPVCLQAGYAKARNHFIVLLSVNIR